MSETITQNKIIVLGKEFKSEDERREYFRTELRKKLPELNKMEGFPIGEDDDIINLSDPPYYTACPNPWLNDFIDQWEQEKKQLEKDGKRSVDFEIDEPYAADISEGKNNPIYTAHTYHTKVPHPAIMRYLLYYTQPGDTVLDAFAGTGMTGVAAQICETPDKELKYKFEQEWKSLFGSEPKWGKRKAICGDLSPYASFISYNYNSPAKLDEVQSEAEKILKNTTDECLWLYKTKHSDGGFGSINYTVWSDVFNCHNCGHEIVFWDAAMDFENKNVKDDFSCPKCGSTNNKKSAEKSWDTYFDTEQNKSIKIAKNVPVLIVYTYADKRFQKVPDQNDLDLIKKINSNKIQTWCPTYELPVGYNTEQPKKSHGVTNIHLFYTKRNLHALSVLNNQIENSKLPNKLKFILTAMINRSTQMNRVHVNNFFFGGV